MECLFRGVKKTLEKESCLDGLEEMLVQDLTAEKPDIRMVIHALDLLGKRLLSEDEFLIEELMSTGLTKDEAVEVKKESAQVIKSDTLFEKLRRELSDSPFEINRRHPREDEFEAWMPLGVLGHVTSSNDAMLPFFSSVEGLLAGNINVIKTAEGAGAVAMSMVLELCRIEPALCPYYYIYPISSKEKELLRRLFACCNAIAVWGSDAATSGVRELAPKGIRIIEWGNRISFAYFTKAGRRKEALRELARDVCVNEQQACSAPQMVYYETEDWDDLTGFGKELFEAMEEISPQYPVHPMTTLEKAELTTQTQLCSLAETMGDKKLLAGKDFRIFIEKGEDLEPSPLYRTIILKGIQRGHLISVLRPLRAYLQSVGLACGRDEIVEISGLLYAGGVTRITEPGWMMSGYNGEPHDGVYALPQYMKRVSIRNDRFPKGMMTFAELLSEKPQPFADGTPLLKKDDFPAQRQIKDKGYLLLKSGGSSGKAKYAPHSYQDAEMTYLEGSRFMIAAGIDPKKDICMNLFYAGDLYGGFISMYESLKAADIVQLPMAAEMDMRHVAEEIILNKVNVLIGMPTYLLRLFEECKEQLKEYHGVEKVLYGGEHFDAAQIDYLKNTFQVKRIGSLAYGCNELGSLGYACEHCKGTEHHVVGTKYLEILKMDEDKPVEPGEIGRLVWTPVDQENIGIARYEIGDLGRFVTEPCACGRKAPKFELLGRYGDVFKFATNYVNYSVIRQILGNEFGYAGWLQLILSYDGKSKMTICVESELPGAVEVLANCYPEIAECLRDKTGIVELRVQTKDDFLLSTGGGKVRSVVDKRNGVDI